MSQDQDNGGSGVNERKTGVGFSGGSKLTNGDVGGGGSSSSGGGGASPKPGRRGQPGSGEQSDQHRLTNGPTDSADLDSLKQDILREIRKELNKFKQEIIEGESLEVN